MKKVFRWLRESNRWKHLCGGAVIGALADTSYCALYAASITGAAMEYKDKAHGGAWDWIDLGLTIAGAVAGRLIRIAVCGGKLW